MEFSQLFKTHSNLRPALLEKMPPMQIVRVSNQNNDLAEENEHELLENGIEDAANSNGKVPNSDSVRSHFLFRLAYPHLLGKYTHSPLNLQNALLDLLGGTDISLTTPSVNLAEKQNSGSDHIPNNQDLLDLLGGIDLSAPAAPPTNNFMSNSNGNNILSMLPSSTPTTPSANILGGSLLDDLTSISNSTAMANGVKLTALDKNGLNVILVPQKNVGDAITGNKCLRVIMSATNNSTNTLEQYLFQAAVPKSFTLQMLSPSGSVLPPGGTITQEMRLTNSAKVNCNRFSALMFAHSFSFPQTTLRMRLRISYVVDGNAVLEQAEVSGFPDDAFD